jgi:hypothetical protein
MLFIIEIYVLEEGLLVLGNDLPVTYNIFNKDFLETKNKNKVSNLYASNFSNW